MTCKPIMDLNKREAENKIFEEAAEPEKVCALNPVQVEILVIYIYQNSSLASSNICMKKNLYQNQSCF